MTRLNHAKAILLVMPIGLFAGGQALAQRQAAKGAPEEKVSQQQQMEMQREKMQQKRRGFAKLMQIVKQEPNVKETQQWALRFYKLEPQRITAMAKAARLKGLVPEVEGSLDNTTGRTFTNTKDGLYPFLNQIDGANPNSYK